MLVLLNSIFLSFTYLSINYFLVVSANTDPDLYVIVSPDAYSLLFYHFKPRLGAAARTW